MTVPMAELHDASMAELRRLGREAGVAEVDSLRHSELVFALVRALGAKEGVQYGGGVLEIHAEGFGFLRAVEASFLPGEADIYVSQTQIRRFRLQTGDTVIGVVRPPKEGERYTALLRVETISGDPPGENTPAFDRAAVLPPEERVALAAPGSPWELLDWWAPLALGQRGLLVAPPYTGGAEALRSFVERLVEDEELVVTVLAVAAPAEDVAWWRTTRAEIIATPLDEPQGRHVQVIDIVIERARRMAEHGEDVVLVVESLSRVARAYLAEGAAAGRDVGGLDAAALQKVRRLFGAPRVLAEGGSLTVLAALPGDPTGRIERALRDDLDEVTPWKVVLSPRLADLGAQPPIDVGASGNLHEARLLPEAERNARRAARARFTGDAQHDLEIVRDAALDKAGGAGH